MIWTKTKTAYLQMKKRAKSKAAECGDLLEHLRNMSAY